MAAAIALTEVTRDVAASWPFDSHNSTPLIGPSSEGPVMGAEVVSLDRAGGAGDHCETGSKSDVGLQCRLRRDAPWISRSTASGVIGVASTATPNGARASLTALARHAPGAIAPVIVAGAKIADVLGIR